MKPCFIILIGPSGVGKSSFLERALKDYPNLRDVTTYTTRPLRAGESEGNPYHFVTKEKFEDLKKQNFFVEWAQVHDKFYGTPKDQLDRAWANHLGVIIDLDIQGARSIKKLYPFAVTVFLKPPSLDALRQRLMKRGQTTDLELRLANAQKELAVAGEFDEVLVNDDFEGTYRTFIKIVEKVLKNQ